MVSLCRLGIWSIQLSLIVNIGLIVLGVAPYYREDFFRDRNDADGLRITDPPLRQVLRWVNSPVGRSTYCWRLAPFYPGAWPRSESGTGTDAMAEPVPSAPRARLAWRLGGFVQNPRE